MSKAVLIPECGRDIGGMKEEISLSPPEKRDGAIGLFSRLLRFESLSKKPSSPDSPPSTGSPTTYYGVYIPCEIKKGPDEEALHVYKNKLEALELVKRYKSARFKVFHNHQDALSFALRGAEPTDTTDGNDNSLMGEKPYPFKAPSPQDMVALRKAIEAGLSSTVRDRVWDNPRFLVSSGNTPAIMQEGPRYNALHIAAKSLNAELCNLILTTVGDPAFVQRLYGVDADADACKEFSSILVDRYLNTPDKALNETPLHFATKLGAEAVVDVLTSFPQCNIAAVNKYGEQPKDIICKRASPANSSCAARICGLLRARYYVPVLHTEDNSAAPTIGLPFTPADPPTINKDPLSPRYEIRAFAGPMQETEAEVFRRKWKTPPRQHRNTFRLKEITKGLETVGRNLAEELKVGWKEYWPFLDTFTDLRSQEGLTLLENYLKAKYETACSFAYSDSCQQSRHSPEELSVSRISLNFSHQTPNGDNTISPISELCVAMKTCKITSERPSHWRKTDPIRQRMCRKPSAKPMNGDVTPTINHTVSQLLCIERTCQVFAKRIADALNFSLTAEPEIAGDSLKSEAKHLQHTIHSYMDDERFQKIDFALTHSRLAQLVVYQIKQHTKELDDVKNLVEFLVRLRCPNDDIFSSDDERKPVRGDRERVNRVKASQVVDDHVRCLSSFICDELTECDISKGPAKSDIECTEIWSKAAKCRCGWKIDAFERNSKKNASFRKNRSILSTSPKGESFIRRLIFDHDIGDGKSQHVEVEQPISVNSPAGDTTLYIVDVQKCEVVEAEISDDDSIVSCNSDAEEDFRTASEHSGDESDAPMEEASDRALAEPFIYGEEPTKMDRLVFDAISATKIDRESFPNVYRWRHTVALYSPTDRHKWLPAPNHDTTASTWGNCPRTPQTPGTPVLPLTSLTSLTSLTPLTPATPRGRGRREAARCSTPNRERDDRAVPLQMSNWLRVTGPNSPRSATATRSVDHNASFDFSSLHLY